MLDYVAGERDFISKLFNEPEAIDSTFKQEVENFRKNNSPWGEIRDRYIAARDRLRDIKIHPRQGQLVWRSATGPVRGRKSRAE
jgi:hypothetical protein